MRYLITGRNGQLAKAFARRLEAVSAEYLAPEESRCNITSAADVRSVVESFRPAVILNCAAYNLVDRAEREENIAFGVNAEGPRVLAEAARDRGALLVHFGTDYVFDGAKESGPYVEDDAPNPLNVYGRSKLAGELAVREALPDRSIVFRLSWVFGEGTQNFIVKLLDWARVQEHLRIACDEVSVPTWTETVAEVTLAGVQQGITGLYHLTNSGYCSRYEWAKAILRKKGIEKFVKQVPTDLFKLPAKRPKFSAMSNRRVAKTLNLPIPAWEEAVERFLKEARSA